MPHTMKKLAEIERELILKTLEKNAYNKCATARELGCSPGTIRNKLKAYKLTVREVVVPAPSSAEESEFQAYQPPKRAKLKG
jgi:transposase-like protein